MCPVTQLQSSVPLSTEEKKLILPLLPSETVVVTSPGRPRQLPPVHSNDDMATDVLWEADFGLDLRTLFNICLVGLPVIFLKSLAEESGKKFWAAAMALHRKVSARNQGQHVGAGGLQVCLRPRRQAGLAATEFVLTMPEALYADAGRLSIIVHMAWQKYEEHDREARDMLRNGSDASRAHIGVSVHALVREAQTTWAIEIVVLSEQG